MSLGVVHLTSRAAAHSNPIGAENALAVRQTLSQNLALMGRWALATEEECEVVCALALPTGRGSMSLTSWP